MKTITGFGLNVWNDSDNDTPVWKMAIYNDYAGQTDTSEWMTMEATPERVARYLEISQDDDWWVYNGDNDFHYILWGVRPL